MLVLSRKCNESVVVPGLGIVLTILEVRHNQVRLGITAPNSVRVYRHEVWARIHQEDGDAVAAGAVPRLT